MVYQLRHCCLVGKQIVEVAVYAIQRVVRLWLFRHSQHHFLAFCQVIAQGNGNLESEIIGLEIIEYAAPKGNIFVTFDIDHETAAAFFGRQSFG